jgi:hypothetical protein
MPHTGPPASYHRIREERARAIREAVSALARRSGRLGATTRPGGK